MKTNLEIGKQMIANQDWYYAFVDYGYQKAYNNAKAGMKRFVQFLNICSKDEAETQKQCGWRLTIRHIRAF